MRFYATHIRILTSKEKHTKEEMLLSVICTLHYFEIILIVLKIEDTRMSLNYDICVKGYATIQGHGVYFCIAFGCRVVSCCVFNDCSLGKNSVRLH